MTYLRMVVDPGSVLQASCSVSPGSSFEPTRWDGGRGLPLGREPRRARQSDPAGGNRERDGIDAGTAPGDLRVSDPPPGTGAWAYD